MDRTGFGYSTLDRGVAGGPPGGCLDAGGPVPRHPGAPNVVPNANGPPNAMSQGLSPMSASDVLPQKRQVIDR